MNINELFDRCMVHAPVLKARIITQSDYDRTRPKYKYIQTIHLKGCGLVYDVRINNQGELKEYLYLSPEDDTEDLSSSVPIVKRT